MQDLKNKVFLVTGATDGIGKAAATEFAKRGATVTLVGRNKAKTEGVVAELKAATGNENLDYLLCDLSRIAEVKRMAEAFKASHDRLVSCSVNTWHMYCVGVWYRLDRRYRHANGATEGRSGPERG
ncbi:SDR family NAD(P)-dependent oxidoreductase [Ralstonia nicotianae]